MLFTTKSLALELESYITSKVSRLSSPPTLYVIQIGDNFASNKYLAMKKAKCEKLGISMILEKFSEDTKPQIIENYINTIPLTDSGLIIQLPIPSQYLYLLEKISTNIDIDTLSEASAQISTLKRIPPTIAAIDLVLKKVLKPETPIDKILSQNLDLSSLIVAVVGQGKLIGAPLLSYLRERQATIISINEHTKFANELTKQADIVITAAGVVNLINDTWLKDNTLLVDAATLESNGSQKGDVDKEKVRENIILCPSPGGIGSLTVLFLIYNLICFSSNFTQV